VHSAAVTNIGARSLLAAGVLALLAVGALALLVVNPFCGGGIDRGDVQDLPSDAVTYQTEDGVQIVASWFVPPGETKPPVVILLHEQDGSRAQWNPLIPELVKKGYAVLAPDIRGHGESTTIVRDGNEEPYQFGESDRTMALADVKAAVEWIKGRDDVDPTRIGIIGSRLGADLTYVSTAVFPEVKAAALITPTRHKPEDPLLGSIPDYAAHDIFIMAGDLTRWEDAVSLGIRIDHVDGDRYEYRSDLDGVALLTIDEPILDILDWFKPLLLEASPTTAPS
jgi:dienelactone hydrolase